MAQSEDASPDLESGEARGLAAVEKMEEMFFVYNGRDEREPHSFIKGDPLY